MNFNQQQQQLVGAIQPIMAPTKKDVLQGRGQGVQRHPGNVKYRTLVFVNKVSMYIVCEMFVAVFVLECGVIFVFILQLVCFLHLIIICICLQGLYAKCPRTDKIKISKVRYCVKCYHITCYVHM